jgi:hypothetical protein
MVWPLIRSACSTASRTATSVASMSVTKPRLTPRLWRWPVPSTRGRPSSSRCRPRRTPWTNRYRGRRSAAARRGRHQFAASTVPAGGGVAPGGTRTIILPGTRRSKRIMSRPSSPTERSILAKRCSAGRRRLGFGQRHGLAGGEAQVPAAPADPAGGGELRLQGRHGCRASGAADGLAVGAGADQQRQVGHLVDRTASSTTPSPSIRLRRP